MIKQHEVFKGKNKSKIKRTKKAKQRTKLRFIVTRLKNLGFSEKDLINILVDRLASK